MSSLTTPDPLVAAAPHSIVSGGRLGRRALWAIYGWAIALGLLVGLLLDSWFVGGVIAVVVATAAVAGISAQVEGSRRAKDRLFTHLVTIAFALALLPLISVLTLIVTEGIARFDVEFLTTDMRGVLGEGGGALHAIVGTLMITLAAAVISIPIGIMSAIYLVEYGTGSSLARAVTFLVDVMTGIPSIVAGLFAYAFFSMLLGPGVSFGVGGAVALSVLMIPVVVRSVEEMLKLVPNELREASYALGVSRWRTIVKVVLPTAAAGIAAGVTLAVARIIGETAPLLIIAGSIANTNWNIFEGKMMSLPVFTYNSYMNPGTNPEPSIQRAWAAALTLMILVMLLNLVARLIARIFGTRQGR